MLETYSPTGSEAQLASFLGSELNLAGFRTRMDSAGNVVGETGDQGPRILLCGHMDTVPGDLPVRLEDGFLYGRGAVDAKSSLAAMIVGCVLAKERSPLLFQATVAAVVEEETSSRGIKTLISGGCPYDLAVFGEPSGLSNIIIGYKGSLQMELTVQTRSGHSASPWLSVNSFEEAVGFWNAVSDSILDNDSQSKFSSVTGCVTRIMAGEQANTIPSRAIMEMDIRLPPGLRAADFMEKIEKLRRAREETRGGVRIFTSVKSRTEAYVGDEDSLGVRAFRRGIRKVTGNEVTLVKKTGTSDMNELAESHRIPMIAYGPGDSSLDHTDDERVSLEEYLGSIEVYATAIQKFSALARETPPVSTTPA